MPNRLAREVSPYLLQHAGNPVDWYPWGEEALARARAEDKPILLSIGYSACHWCHVMERESFEDGETAALMNALFVNVKVDREERPDLDQVYQLVVQLMGRGGGWPLTVFLSPDQKPFFGGTYFPPEPRYGMPSFRSVLVALAEAYRDRRGDVLEQAQELAVAIASVGRGEPAEGGAPLGPDLLERAARKLVARFDDTHGGFGTAPKFPNTMALEVLLRRGALEGDARAVERFRLALDRMREGGLVDQLGGGFHRYSTDAEWLVPHFEKMLYDNALLLRTYVDGWRHAGREAWADTARRTVAWLLGEMQDARGGFYASQDADSEGEEGKFFVWRPDEVRAELAGDDEATRVALACFGVTEEGNFEKSGASVLHVARPASAEESAALERARLRLLEARAKRPKPFRDEKILASWCSLAVSALADAAMAMGEPAWLDAAKRAFAFLERTLVVRDAGGVRALRLAKDDVAKGQGFLDDHAYLACAALDLYEATGEPRHVELACALAETILARFGDGEGGFFFSPDDGEALLARSQDTYDQAVPSGAAMAALALARLGALRGGRFEEEARRAAERLGPPAVGNPFAHAQSVLVADRLVRGSVDVVLVGPRDDARTVALARAAFRAYLPNRTLAWIDPTDPASTDAAPALAEGKPARPAPAAYVCWGRTCSLPVETPAELTALLARTGR
jgi:hypothetical protein